MLNREAGNGLGCGHIVHATMTGSSGSVDFTGVLVVGVFAGRNFSPSQV